MKLLAQTPISYYPLNQAKDICVDTHLTIEFDLEVKAGNKGIISIVDKTTRKVVDRIDMSIPAGPTEGQPKNPADNCSNMIFKNIAFKTDCKG